MNFIRASGFALALSASILLNASASSILYSNAGTVATTQTITASAGGRVDGFFVGYSANDTDEIRMVDTTTGYTSAYYFANKTTAAGAEADFGSVSAGDTLVFELYNETTGMLLASNPSLSADGINHAYTTLFGGGTLNGVPYTTGDYTYISMEDLSRAVSDLDYNDDEFLLTNVSVNVTREPSSVLLLGTGLLGVAGLRLKRFFPSSQFVSPRRSRLL